MKPQKKNRKICLITSRDILPGAGSAILHLQISYVDYWHNYIIINNYIISKCHASQLSALSPYI
jgi:hypothetical protein